MALWDRVMTAMALAPWDHQERSELSLPVDSVTAMRITQAAERPWRPSSVREALGVPAVLQACTLIANTMGTFTLQAFKNGALVPNEERPRILVRPNPFSTSRDFLREVGWSMATRGENWMWIAARNSDGSALSVIPVPSAEVRVGGSDWLQPRVLWRGANKTGDMKGVFLSKELGSSRGFGPLQYCGAAISAAVESQEWAANFFAMGGNPSTVLKSEVELSPEESQDLRDQWAGTPPNMPQVISGPLDVKEMAENTAAAQMLDARMHNAGEAARMFSIPGALLEYARGGSSLTYQNVATLFDQFLRQCLIPNYLEPLEQVMTDLLPRNWVARFNVDAVLRADIKTRYDVYESGITKSGVLTVDEARRMEGLIGGSVENAPVPFAMPAAIPAGVPARTFSEWRCPSCNRKLAEVRGAGTELRCRCGELVTA